jgi:hypothetical protein
MNGATPMMLRDVQSPRRTSHVAGRGSRSRSRNSGRAVSGGARQIFGPSLFLPVARLPGPIDAGTGPHCVKGGPGFAHEPHCRPML